MDGQDAGLCSNCGAQGALVYCAQHAARFCLVCDLNVHKGGPSHERTPLCGCCLAAPAVAHCSEHGVPLCAPCLGQAGCVAGQHRQRPALTFTQNPDPSDLVMIVSGDIIPPQFAVQPPQFPVQQQQQDNPCASDLSDIVQLPDPHLDDTLGTASSELRLVPGDGDVQLLTQQDWPNCLDGDEMEVLPTQQAGYNPVVGHHAQEAFEPQASSSSGHQASPYLEETETTMLPDGAALQSMTISDNNAAAYQFSSVTGTNGVNLYPSDMAIMPPSDGFVFTPGYPTQDQMPPSDGFVFTAGYPIQDHQMPPSDGFVFTAGYPIQDHQMPPSDGFVFTSGYPTQDQMPPPDGFVFTTGYPTTQDQMPASDGFVFTAGYPTQDHPMPPAKQPTAQDIEDKRKWREKRNQALRRYRNKKKNRSYGKRIMYESRKVTADTRRRVRGRFVKSSPNTDHQN